MKKTNYLLMGLLVASCLSGCGKTSNYDENYGVYDGSEVTIKFYHTMGNALKPVFDLYLEKFNEMYPNIHVDAKSIGGYDDVRDQIKTEISAADGPNIAYCYPDHIALYNKANRIVVLDNYINNTDMQPTYYENAEDNTQEVLGLTQAQIDDFVTGYYEEGRAFGDGKLYSLPLSKSTEVLYYDLTFFEEHNLKVPTNWDEMEDVCRQIKQINPASVPLGYDSSSNWFITMCEQYDSPYTSATGDHYLFNNDKNKSFVKEIASWYKDGLVTIKELYGSYTSGLFTNMTPNENGELIRSYMCIGSSAGATYQLPAQINGKYPFEVGIAPIPQVSKETASVISQGPSLCLFKSDNIQQVNASWLLMKFLTTNLAFQASFSMFSGYVPVIKSVFNDPTYKSQFIDLGDTTVNLAASSVKVCVEQADNYFYSPAFVGSSEARDQVGSLLANAMTQAVSVDGLTDAELNNMFQDAVDECEYMS